MTAEKSKRAAYTLEYKLEADGKVDQNNPTQFGRALRHPGIEMIAVYSPEARGQSERAFSPTRNGYQTNWLSQALPTGKPPTAIYEKSICLLSTPSLPVRYRDKEQLSCHGLEAIWRCSMDHASWPTTTEKERDCPKH